MVFGFERSSSEVVILAIVNLAEILLASGDATAPCLIGPDGSVHATYGSLRSDVATLAADIAANTQAGDRVAFAIPNCTEFVIAYLAILYAGRIAVPLNPSAPRAEIDREIAVVSSSLRLDVAAVREVLDNGQALEFTAVEQSADSVAVCLFTSGTAGAPKAAMLTHGSLLANLEQVQSAPGLAFQRNDIALGALPLFHIFGLNVVLALALKAGAALSLVEAFHPAEVAQQIATTGVTIVAGVPAMYQAWLAVAGKLTDNPFAKVRLAVSGAAALDERTHQEFATRFNVNVYEGYGLTEASPIVSTTAVDQAVRSGSIGPALPGVLVRLVDRDGADALADDPGEIWVKGPNVFAGYWNDDAQTSAVLTDDGWLRTGDIAVADANGWLTLVDRSKDLIIVSGFNVYPAEVEDALCHHDAVEHAAVVGEPDERSGEHIVAFIVVRSGNDEPTPTQLIAHLRRRVARYKIPARFEFVSELPQTFAGKVVRRALRSDTTTMSA